MNIQALFFISLSALFHIGWNFWVKNSQHKQIYIWWMFATTFLIFLPITLWLESEWKAIPLKSILACLGAGFMYFFYQVCTSEAYQEGDLSLVYPLSNLTPLFVPFWAIWFLHERLSLLGVVGILITAVGTGLIQFSGYPMSQTGTSQTNKKPVFWALGASFFASIGSVLDKAGVEALPQSLMYHYVTLMVVFMLGFLSFWVWSRFPAKIILAEIKHHPYQILIGGIMLASSFLFFRYGIKICPISYAVAIRRASIILSVWLGVIFFKEAHGFLRTLASILIIVGLILLKLA